MDKAKFEPRLESLRGLAAFVVALQHTFARFEPGTANTIVSWILWPTNAQSCVLFFFVLSGYVLGQALNANSKFFSYLVRRAFRIFPIFVLSILFAYACLTIIGVDVGHPIPTRDDLWCNLLLQSSAVNGPTWSIYPEVIGSIWLPVFVMVHKRVPHRWRWVLFITIFTTLSFSPYRLLLWFYCGFFLPTEIAMLVAGSWLFRVVLFAVGYAIVLKIGMAPEYYKFITIGPSAVGASLMIGAVISNTDFMSWLKTSPLRFLGRVSYSFYLLHWPIYYLWSVAFIGVVLPSWLDNNFTLCVISMTSALAVSAITYKFIELPAITFGKMLTSPKPTSVSLTVQ